MLCVLYLDTYRDRGENLAQTGLKTIFGIFFWRGGYNSKVANSGARTAGFLLVKDSIHPKSDQMFQR